MKALYTMSADIANPSLYAAFAGTAMVAISFLQMADRFVGAASVIMTSSVWTDIVDRPVHQLHPL